MLNLEDTNKDKDSKALLKEITDEAEKIKQKQDETNAKAINDEKDIHATLKNIQDEQALKKQKTSPTHLKS